MNTSPDFGIRMGVGGMGESFSKEVIFRQRTKGLIEISQVKKDRSENVKRGLLTNVVGVIININQCLFCFRHFFSTLKSFIYFVFFCF